MTETKTCRKCLEDKEAPLFDLNRCVCKSCCKEQYRQWREQNKDRVNEKNRQWYEQNKDHRKEYDRQWREQNKESLKKYDKQRTWHKQNKDRSRELYKQWCEQNKNLIRDYFKKSRENLTDGYVKTFFRTQKGFAPNEIPPEIIEAKREQLRLHRLVVQLQQAIIEVETTEKETP